jgi:cation:H+ antiporter
MVESVPLAVAVVVVTTLAIWVGSDWLEESSEMLGIYYNLPPVVQGGLIAAVGSSFPELASVIFAALAGSVGLGIGAIVGSAIFNILVIPALSVIVPRSQIDATRTLVHKETLFYLLSVLVLFLTFALGLIYAPTEGSLQGELTPALVLFPLSMYFLYLFLQWQDTNDYQGVAVENSIQPLREWAKLAAGLLVILVAVESLVDAVITIGEAAGTPEFLWGITVAAAATSVPDALVSIQAASNDRDVASVANVIGSNVFDLLVVIPTGVLLTGAATFDFSLAAPMMGCLLLATMLLFVAMRTNLVLTPREASVLLFAYVVFVVWVTLEALTIVTFLPI